jgi:hypothetical protein
MKLRPQLRCYNVQVISVVVRYGPLINIERSESIVLSPCQAHIWELGPVVVRPL